MRISDNQVTRRDDTPFSFSFVQVPPRVFGLRPSAGALGTRVAAVMVILLLGVATPAPAADLGPWLVYTSTRTGNRDIFIISVSTAATRQLTATPQPEYQPAWSWDGRMIAYVRGGDIWTMRADGTGQTNRTPRARSREKMPYWLPDGRLGFTSNVTGVERLYVLGTRGWQPLGLTGWAGAVSRDGKKICYTRGLEVYWATIGRALEHNVSRSNTSDHHCVWDPTNDNPSVLLVHSHRRYEQAIGRKGTGRIWRVTRGGVFDPIPLTEGSDNSEGDNHPAWHKSGWIAWNRHIVCTPDRPCSEQRDKTELFAMAPNGRVFRLTVNEVEDSEPHFRP